MAEEETEERPYFYLSEIWDLFSYSSINSAYVAIHRGHFPVETYRIAGRRVADREIVRAFFKAQRQYGAKMLRRRIHG